MKLKSKKLRRLERHFFYCLFMAFQTKKNGWNPYYFNKQAEITGNKIKVLKRYEKHTS